MGSGSADEVSFDPTGTGLATTNPQDATVEIASDVTTNTATVAANVALFGQTYHFNVWDGSAYQARNPAFPGEF